MNEWHFYLLFDCVAQLLAVISFFKSHVPSRIYQTLALNVLGWKKTIFLFDGILSSYLAAYLRVMFMSSAC